MRQAGSKHADNTECTGGKLGAGSCDAAIVAVLDSTCRGRVTSSLAELELGSAGFARRSACRAMFASPSKFLQFFRGEWEKIWPFTCFARNSRGQRRVELSAQSYHSGRGLRAAPQGPHPPRNSTSAKPGTRGILADALNLDSQRTRPVGMRSALRCYSEAAAMPRLPAK